VEEDSKFEFYVEDLESNSNTKVENPAGADIPDSEFGAQAQAASQIIANSVEEEYNENDLSTADTAANLETPDSSMVFYTNPRYGDRYACKDSCIMSTVTQRHYISPKTAAKYRKLAGSKLQSKRCSTSENFGKEKPVLNPIRKSKSLSPQPESLPSFIISNSRGYKDSTQFLFPPVLSESGLSVPLSGKRKSRETDFDLENEVRDPDPDPDMVAIRDYNIQLVRAMTSPSVSSAPGESNSTVYVRGIPGPVGSSILALTNGSKISWSKAGTRSSSTIVTNIPCDSWMMFPLRVLPGEMVPWGLLIFVPLLLLLIGVIGYVLVSISSGTVA
jgi:hypothetical protein